MFRSQFVTHSILPTILLPALLSHFLASQCYRRCIVIPRAYIPLTYPQLEWCTTLALIFVQAWLVSYYRSFKRTKRAASLNAIPIPVVRGSWPGNIDVLMRLLKGWKKGYINETLRDIFQETDSPTVNLRILGVDQIWTCDPVHIKHILVSSFHSFDKGEPQRQRMASFLGRGIFAADGELWKTHRAMIRPYLTKNLTTDIPLFERHLHTAISVLENASLNGAPINIQSLAHAYTLDLALEAFFGMNSHSYAGEHDSNSPTSQSAINTFAHSMEQAAQITILRARRGPMWRLFEVGGDAIASHAKVMHQWIDSVIMRARENHKNNDKENSNTTNTFIGHLINSTDDDSLIRDQLINMLFGARDTTASLITFVVYFLALDNRVYDKLYEEINRLCPLEQGLPSLQQLKDLVYLRAVIDETLRVFPSVPINTKYSNVESVFPAAITNQSASASSSSYSKYYTTPLYMPPTTSVSLITLLMQRRIDVWGGDAEEFWPERWLLSKNELDSDTSTSGMVATAKRPPQDTFVPFSAGPRLCPGMNFAYVEASFFLIRVLQSGLKFQFAEDAQPPETRPPNEWKKTEPMDTNTSRRLKHSGSLAFASPDKARKSKERCWPAAAFTLYSKGGMWMRVVQAGGKLNSN